ncbi:hypothetical protein CALCODRAFT_498166 [Calocera cornea HHB12733]|uniref:Uncharacterized protein n=1 Tax=Calocera cornea HHB12733 TaxID=1353952 RepID=A0A165EYY1_9BASI|nr:hypothetical protein CALCODRAFT_498166 [Calocera cornea HHB12733]
MRRERERRVEQGEEAGERPLAGADDDDDDDDDDEEEEEAEDDDADRQHTASPPLAPAAAPPAAQEDSQWTESSDDEEDRFFAHLSDFSDFSSDFYSGRRASAAAAAAARGGEETESDSTGDDEGMDGVEGSDGSLSSVSRAEAARAGLLDYAAGAGPWRRSRRSKGKGKVPAKPHAPSPATSAKLGKRKRPYTTSDDEKRRKPSKRREKRPKMVLVEDGEGRLVFGGEWERESLSWASEEEEMMELFPSEDELPRARPADAGGEEEGEGEATEPEPERLAFVPLSQPDELLLPLPSLPLLPVLSSELDSEGDGPSEASSEWTGEGETTDEEDVPGLRKEEAEAMLELGLVRSRSAEREREREREMQGVDPMLLSPPALGLQMELAPPAPTLASVIASAAAAAAAPPAPPVLATPTKTPRAVRPLPRPIPQSSSKVVRPHPLPALSTWTTPLKSMIFVVDGTDRAGVSPFARLRWTGAGQKRRRESSSRSEASWYYEGSKRARTAYDEEHGEDLGLEHDPDQENELDPSASSQGELALVRSPESPDALDLDDLLDTSYFLYDESIPSSEAEGEDNEDEGDTAIMRHLTRLDSVPLGQWFRRARAQGAEAGMEMSLSVAAFAMDHEGDDTLLAPDLVGRSMVVVSPIIFPARDAYIPERSPSPVMLDGEAAGPLSSISLRAALSPKKRADKAVKSHKERRRDKKRVLGQKGGGIDVTPKVRNRTHGRPF